MNYGSKFSLIHYGVIGMKKIVAISVFLAVFLVSNQVFAETIRIAVGHQSKCTDPYTAGIIVKELELIQKFLPKTGIPGNG